MAKTKAKKRPVRTAKISAKPVKVRKRYPFASTPRGQSFIEDDISQWPRLRVSASRYNQKHGTKFTVTAEKENDKIVRLRCGEPAE